MNKDSADKTVTGIFAAAYSALNAAGNLAQAVDEADTLAKAKEEVKALHVALAAVPQCDMDALVKYIISLVKGVESMCLLGVSFEPMSPGVLARVTLRFGDGDITLCAPFDEAGSAAMWSTLGDAVGKKSKILRVN